MTYAQASAEYDRLYDAAQAVLNKFNPCQIAKGKAGCMNCTGHPKREATGDWTARDFGTPDLCCSDCKHHGPTGCTVKCLGCKVWLCQMARDRHPRTAWLLEGVWLEALEFFGKQLHWIGSIRQTKEETLARLKPEGGWTKEKVLTPSDTCRTIGHAD